MIDAYFFDTYAIFELINGNPSYKRFENSEFVTSIFNLAELNWGLKKKFDESISDEITNKYGDFLVNAEVDDIKKAMSFRKKHKDLSIPDAIGYTIAKRLGIKFLTGDDDFKDLDNVEFVKK